VEPGISLILSSLEDPRGADAAARRGYARCTAGAAYIIIITEPPPTRTGARSMQTAYRRTLAVLAVVLLSSCATLGQVIQPPRFQVAPGRQAELRLLPPAAGRPLGALAIRLWAEVGNPNPFGTTLTALRGDLALEGTRAATVDFPLGLPLLAAQDTIIPFDITINPTDVPAIAPIVARAFAGQTVDYDLVGTITVDAGLLGQPSFGPSSWLRGSVQARH
jgi:hypothetical protein